MLLVYEGLLAMTRKKHNVGEQGISQVMWASGDLSRI